MAAGLAIAIACAIPTVVSLIPVATAPEHTVPGTFTVPAKTGTYGIYERLDAGELERDGLTGEEVVRTHLMPRHVDVHDAAGAHVRTTLRFDRVDLLERDGVTYAAAVRFRAPHDGRYTISISSDPDAVIVTRPVPDVLRSHAATAIASAGGVLLLILGGLLAAIGGIRRSRARRAEVRPAGWFPDPDGGGMLRYHDGRAWTGFRSPPPTDAGADEVAP